mmetsp:Transcript_18127/g.44485  ORF Transcript_18127/g.44485 Transcript_18127/m.44485 type:complete len:288 (+) Transcript_18127:112-975(+)|eukprot:CAMPEP_0206258116 /NCGR_PEP_ID=MMETSP0047_2-20121206/25737_1 /ASSEMBLY_ACC=CAM_ASM_000192 /TAXON_ID=195065 /ORGANISM="Chroomonas mesostigmatica_cf, Strain CCMP1168" /LENGTH=287 /DNA_ID=CAMNT_0053684817 /DNA_START=29 /DNA_END=892 /DNA_ORIENTATION=-
MPAPKAADSQKWERTKKTGVPQLALGPEMLMGLTTVLNPSGGSLTTRCIRSTGWETPFQVEESLKPSLSLTRFAPTPLLNQTFDPHSAHYAAGSMSDRGMFKDAQAKAWLNQASTRCPYATDRRFVAGSWLYKTSYLYKSEPIADRRYVEMHTRRPLTQSRKMVFAHTKTTQQIVRLISQKINERVSVSAYQTRAVNQKHPVRVFMSMDKEHKGHLTAAELRDALGHFNVTLQHEEVDKLIDAFAWKERQEDGSPTFDYNAFCETLNSLANTHPLGGYAGNSWGWMG